MHTDIFTDLVKMMDKSQSNCKESLAVSALPFGILSIRWSDSSSQSCQHQAWEAAPIRLTQERRMLRIVQAGCSRKTITWSHFVFWNEIIMQYCGFHIISVVQLLNLFEARLIKPNYCKEIKKIWQKITDKWPDVIAFLSSFLKVVGLRKKP